MYLFTSVNCFDVTWSEKQWKLWGNLSYSVYCTSLTLEIIFVWCSLNLWRKFVYIAPYEKWITLRIKGNFYCSFKQNDFGVMSPSLLKTNNYFTLSHIIRTQTSYPTSLRPRRIGSQTLRPESRWCESAIAKVENAFLKSRMRFKSRLNAKLLYESTVTKHANTESYGMQVIGLHVSEIKLPSVGNKTVSFINQFST